MAEPNADILKKLVEAANATREYLRVTGLRRPELDYGDSQLLPERIELPSQDARQAQPVPVEDVVIPLPRQRPYDEGYLLSEESEGAPSPNFAIHHHYSQSNGQPALDVETFFSQSGFKWSSIQIGLTLRKCAEIVPTGNHPGYKKPVLTGAPLAGAGRGNIIDSYAGDDSTWLELAYAAFDTDGTDLGHGTEVITSFHIHARITDAGSLELRVTNDGIDLSCVITGAGERVTYSANPKMQEFGVGGCHDDRVWGDGVYEMGSYDGKNWVPE